MAMVTSATTTTRDTLRSQESSHEDAQLVYRRRTFNESLRWLARRFFHNSFEVAANIHWEVIADSSNAQSPLGYSTS